jgi:hypothetical protein
VVHGDLHEDNLLVDGARVTAVTGWTDLRIGDPADDFAWLVASNEQDFVDTVLSSYTSSRRDVPDKHLLRRAALSAEFALAQFLVKGVAAADADMIAEAEGMLETLAGDIAEHGGQSISVEPLPAPAEPGPAEPSGAEPSGAEPSSAQARDTGSVSSVSAQTPAVTVVPVPASVVPAVHVSPIPAEAQATAPEDQAKDGSAPTEAPKSPASDDTSTAAITIIDVKKD